MPAIQVAKTDTFEKQREKINQISDQIFTISAGGSDLSTGILRLGDGTKPLPSLSFTNDIDTGLIRSQSKTIGVVSNTKLITEFNNSDSRFFNNVNFVKNSLGTSFLNVTNSGQNYDAGTYSNIPVIGGSGINGSLAITVESFIGTITNNGVDYTPGSFSAVVLIGGNGSGAQANFQVSGVEGETTSGGSGYGDGLYNGVSFTGGNGSGATFSCSVNNGEVGAVQIGDQGTGYRNGDVLSASASDLGGSGSGFQFTITSTPGVVDSASFQFSERGNGYQVGDVLGLAGAVTGVSTTLVDQSTDITVTQAQADSIQEGFIVTQTGGTGVLVGSGGAGGGSNPTVFAINGTTISLSAEPDTAGSATLNFTPPWGVPTTPFAFTVDKVGAVDVVSVSEGGSGYAEGDVLTVSEFDLVQAITYDVTVVNTDTLNFSVTVPSNFISVGDQVYVPGGGIETTSVSASTIGSEANAVYSNLTGSTNGNGSGAVFEIVRGFGGDISSADVTSSGVGYAASDTVTILGTDVGGSTPADDVTITISGVSNDGQEVDVEEIILNGGTIAKVVVKSGGGITDGNSVAKFGTTSPAYAVNTVDNRNVFYLDDGSGSGEQYLPRFTIYSGNTYRFNNGNASHPFRFSQFRDGTHAPSVVTGVATTVDLSTSTRTVIVADTTGILAGMQVSAGGGGGGSGQVDTGTLVESVDSSTQITLSVVPSSDGAATLDFSGYAYADNVTYESSYTEILVTDDTPSPLYYYCAVHPDMGGLDQNEAFLTVNTNNPKVFGSGFSITLTGVDSSIAAAVNIADRKISTEVIDVTSGEIDTLGVSGTLTAPNILGTIGAFTTINSSANFTLSATGYDTTINADNFKVGTLFNVTSSSGNIETSGEIKTLGTININDKTTITDNTISTTAGSSLILQPASGRTVKVNSTGAIIIPVGDNASRPGSTVVESGAIRFNTDNGQYEGYSGATSSWSSLGGVRDLDGNTFILAEETVGANDNNLWFINDNVNTMRVSPTYLEFVNMKKMRSPNVSAPDYSDWTANTPVLTNSYLKWKNNLYKVTLAGTTATSGNEPTHTTGTQQNGSAELEFFGLAVAPLTFEDIEEIRIGPTGSLPLVINGDLRLADNVLSTDINDLFLRPNPGKKVNIDTNTSLVVPNGTTAERGTPEQGSIRFNTSDSLFEGYDGTNWGSLGGVKDVDQNTYIIPELSAGSNENILYFYNDGSNTVQLTTTALDFYSVDTIRSQTSNQFEITANLMTFNNAETTFDNTDSTKTFLHTSKQYFDLGVSTGVYVDPILRLDDQGDVYLNTGFGTGNYNGVKVFDGDLKEFELADVKLLSEVVTLIKGSSNNGGSNIYDTAVAKGAKVTLIAEDTVTNEKEFIEFGVTDDGSNIFHTEYGNLKTNYQIVIPSFEYTATNEARLNFTLGANVPATNTIKITVSSTITKK